MAQFMFYHCGHPAPRSVTLARKVQWLSKNGHLDCLRCRREKKARGDAYEGRRQVREEAFEEREFALSMLAS